MAKRKKKATKKKTAKRKPARKTAKRKTAKKKTAKRTTTAKKPTAAFKAPKLSAARTPRTKSQIMTTLAEQTNLSKKEVGSVFEALNEVISKDIGKGGCGTFTVPGLMKIRRVHKPARKARKGINPFTGEETMFKAKPAHNVVKVRPLKALKDAAN